MLQGFHWDSFHTSPWWGVISQKAGDISNAGFNMVWFPPSGQAASDQGYIPVQLYVQDSMYGTQAQLQQAISDLHSRGVAVIGDMVLNHRVGSTSYADFTNPTWGLDSICSNSTWPGGQGQGAADTGMSVGYARDIDHTKTYVQQSLIQWMNWLRSTIGYDGWRYDFALGYAGTYNKIYNDGTSPVFAVAEVWPSSFSAGDNSNRQAICNWIDSTQGSSSAFDFTTKGLLQQAIEQSNYSIMKDSNGKPAGLIGWWPQKAVTFVDNHDTGPSTGGDGGQNLWPFPSGEVMQGYAYILTHPGIPCVYWPHYFDWGSQMQSEIKALIQYRKSHNITYTSNVQILAADNSRYAAQIDNSTLVKIGPGSWQPPDSSWKLTLSGQNYAVWSK
jgi:alpha-amylase